MTWQTKKKINHSAVDRLGWEHWCKMLMKAHFRYQWVYGSLISLRNLDVCDIEANCAEINPQCCGQVRNRL